MTDAQHTQIEQLLRDAQTATTEAQLVQVRDAVVASMTGPDGEPGAPHAARCGEVILAIATRLKALQHPSDAPSPSA